MMTEYEVCCGRHLLKVAMLAYSGIMDIVLALLPWKIVWTITINKREKVGALIAISMGVLYALPSRLLFAPSS